MLVVEDNSADILLIREAIEALGLPVTFHIVKDGEEAIEFFDYADASPDAPCPDLVILDINLPKHDGGQVLEYMRMSERCRDALVLAVSTSDSPRDQKRMAELGANGYFHKPSEFDAFMKLGPVVQRLLGLGPQNA